MKILPITAGMRYSNQKIKSAQVKKENDTYQGSISFSGTAKALGYLAGKAAAATVLIQLGASSVGEMLKTIATDDNDNDDSKDKGNRRR